MCGQSPLYVPTTVNAILRNIDAVDCAATNVSCTNLTVQGEPISTAIQNMKGSTPGNTVFTGRVTADNATIGGKLNVIDVDATDIVTETATCDTVTTRIAVVRNLAVEDLTVSQSSSLTGLECGGLTVTDYLSVTGATELKGPTTFTANIIQSAGGAVLKNTNVASLTNPGTLTQTGAATFSGITQTAGTTSLKTTTVESLTNSGTLTQTGPANFATDITQNAGTATFKALSVTGNLAFTDLTVSGTSSLKAVNATQVTQSVPSFALYKIQGFQNVTTDAEVSVKFTSQANSTGTINQGISNPSYNSTTGVFTNSSSFARVFMVSYTLFWQGASGGRRMCYIRTADTTGNYPQGSVGVGGNGQEASTNTAMSYILGGDNTTIRMTGCAPILIAPNSNFSVYAYHSQTGTLTLAGHVSITVL